MFFENVKTSFIKKVLTIVRKGKCKSQEKIIVKVIENGKMIQTTNMKIMTFYH